MYPNLLSRWESPGKAEKLVFGSCKGWRGGKLPNSCLRVGCPGNVLKILNLTARRFNYVAGRVRVGMRFCKVPIDGRKFGVTIKLSGLSKAITHNIFVSV
jgi:hypothetical protein